MGQRVFVTGMGAYTALGDNLQSSWGQMLKGNSVIEPIPERWRQFSDFNSQYWSPLPELDFSSKGISRAELLQNDVVTLLMVSVIHEALLQSQIGLTNTDQKIDRFCLDGFEPGRAGVIVGTGTAGANTFLAHNAYQILKKTLPDLPAVDEQIKAGQFADYKYPKRYNRFMISMMMPNAVSAYPAIRYGLRGANETVTSACASGTEAIAKAYWKIRDGELDLAVTGGAEYLYDDYGHIFRGFDIANTLARGESEADINRPFDERRNGFLFSEGGAACMLLESEESCLKRGVTPVAEVLSAATTFDAYNIMQPEPSGKYAKEMLKSLLSNSGVDSSDIDYVNTHGTGTQANDKIEADLINKCFPHKPIVNSTKSLLGHTIGASGAIEAVITVMSLKQKTTHICRNLARPVADLNFCKSVQPSNINIGLSQSFAFGGHNSAVLFSALN